MSEGNKIHILFFTHIRIKKSVGLVDDQNVKGVLKINKQKKVIVEKLQW